MKTYQDAIDDLERELERINEDARLHRNALVLLKQKAAELERRIQAGSVPM